MKQNTKPGGETRYTSGSEQTKYTYTGQYSYVSDFGLHFYNARWYDSSLGRFAQADSIIPSGVQGLDRYSYTFNNPINYTDPSGHVPVDCYGTNYCGSQNADLLPDPYKPPKPKPQPRDERDDLIKNTNNESVEDTGPITDLILRLPFPAEEWSTIATGLDVLAWLTDLYAASAVTYAGFFGAGLPAPLIAAGLPEVPVVTGLAGMAIAELLIQPILFTGNVIASLSTGATIIADTKVGGTRIEEGKFSISTLNSMALTDLGWMSNEAYLSLTIQSIAVANDLQWTSLPFPQIP
jgi:RHS repeat-associated protein